uniref:SAP domain-containing protein n=1 Tax=Panagrolaimus superbus TaxID=310955 RepID=A0A914YZA7_9BILA
MFCSAFDACVDPLIRVRGQLLKRNKLVDNLNSKLRKRPGPLELVNRKILQVDAELEQAVQEGRLPFTTTLSSPSSTFFEEPEMISTIIPPPQIRHDDQQYSSSSTSSASLSSTVGPKAKIRKKSQQLHRTPYDNTSISTNKIIKLKAIANGKRSTNESIGSLETSSTSSNLSADFSSTNGISPMETDDIHSDNNMQSETNYEINLKQQQLFLQWQEDHFKSPRDTNAITPAMSSTTSNCSTPLQSNDTPSIHSTRSSFSVSSTHSGNHGNTRFSSLYSPSVSPTQGNETILQIPIIEPEKPKSKLADFKVQDLKVECKKRQLPVSGAKPQLLERLKPYEDAILATLTSTNGSIQSTNITTISSLPVECSEVSSTSAGTCQNSCGHQRQQQQTIFCQTKPSFPAQDVITDYLQQCQPQQSQQQQQQKPLVLQLPPNSKPPQLVQVLVDSNGTVVGVAAMPQQTITPAKSSTPCCCVQCKKQPGSHISTIAETAVVQSKSHESKPNEPTFSFSQMGSGGQFTLANSSPIVSECRQMSQNCAGCIAAASSQSGIKIVSSDPTSTTSTRPIVATVQASNSSHTLCTAPPLIRSHTSSTMSSIKKPHIALQKSESNSSTVEQTVAAVAHRRHSIPATVFSHSEDLSDNILSPDQTCQIPSPNVNILSAQDDETDTNLDEIDPNVLMTAKTFSQHEENLRIQQRLIEDLQAELAKSQEQLRREQKLIIAAKRLQLRTDQQTGKQCTQAEILLNNLDIKQINKHHIQHFIQHKSQQQSVQTQSNDYQQLLQVEQKLQEELHMEQAVQDIVRLIKQDGRTALLIVQLLRRYQLERNHQVQQAAAAQQQQQKPSSIKLSPQRSSTTANISIPGQNELTPGSIQQQECSGRTSVMSSKSLANENGGNCCQQHQPQSVESCCANRTCLSQQKSAQIVVIDDSPVSSPAPPLINNNTATVGETLQKQKEITQRSKSQNPRTNKRKNNGSRSIWAKTNLIEKSASFTNANTSGTPSKIVDMEEIFRTVINDTSDSRDSSLSTATPTTDNCQQKSLPLQHPRNTNMDASSELVPQLNGFHLVTNNDDSSNSAIADDQMDHTSSYQQLLNASNGYSQEYIIQQQPMQTEICSTTAIFIQPENISSCHVDCYSKPRNKNSPERVEIIENGNEYIHATNINEFGQIPIGYAKNEDFEDLMDVLRDDQECINGHIPEDENCGREILGYTTAELATFLAADENIVSNGNIYETFVQTTTSEHYPPSNYQQHCVPHHQNNITYEHQGNIEYDINGGNLEHHQTLHIEPHQEQAIDDILNNSEMMESSVEWFDNLFQSPMTERQMTVCGNRPPTGANIHRPMDTFV